MTANFKETQLVSSRQQRSCGHSILPAKTNRVTVRLSLEIRLQVLKWTKH